MSIPSLKELCIKQLNEKTKTEIFLNRSSSFRLYLDLVSVEFFRTWSDANTNMIDRTILNDLNDATLDIIYERREEHPSLYWIVIEHEFWDTVFLF